MDPLWLATEIQRCHTSVRIFSRLPQKRHFHFHSSIGEDPARILLVPLVSLSTASTRTNADSALARGPSPPDRIDNRLSFLVCVWPHLGKDWTRKIFSACVLRTRFCASIIFYDVLFLVVALVDVNYPWLYREGVKRPSHVPRLRVMRGVYFAWVELAKIEEETVEGGPLAKWSPADVSIIEWI